MSVSSVVPVRHQSHALTQAAVLCGILAIFVSFIGCGGGSSNAAFLQASVANTQNPQVAQITVKSSCAGQFMAEFGTDTSYGRTTSWYPSSGSSQEASFFVAGMKASTAYHMRVQSRCQSSTSTGTDMTFTTGAPPSLPYPAILVSRPGTSSSTASSSAEAPGIELVDTTSPTAGQMQAFFTDRDGNPIWYYNVDSGYYPSTFKQLPNGDLIFSLVTFGGDSFLREVDLAGNTVRQLRYLDLQQSLAAAGFDIVPTEFHHDVLPLDNGHLIALVMLNKNFTDLPGYPGTTQVVGDALVDLDENWNPVWVWNSFDSNLDINRHLSGLPDWTHANAVVYSPSDGNLLLSFRHQSWIIKIDYNNGKGTGDILWRLGYQGDFALTNNGVPTDDPSLWFSFQHFPSIISQSGSQTTLAIWDNGDFRPLDTSGTVCTIPGPPNCYSRATVYTIDESAKVANLDWAYAPPSLFSVWGGSINQLSNGNIEFDLNSPLTDPDPSTASVIQEVTQTSTPTVVWQMSVPLPMYAYRAYRVPSLYPGVSWQY